MELNETVEMMQSESYKQRFQAEYIQAKIRYEKLHKMLVKYEAGTLDFKPTCDMQILREQASAMGEYLHCMEIRAELEEVILPEVKLEFVPLTSR